MVVLFKPKNNLLWAVTGGFLPAFGVLVILAILNGRDLFSTLVAVLIAFVGCVIPLVLFIYTTRIEIGDGYIKLVRLVFSSTIRMRDIQSISAYKRGSYIVLGAKLSRGGKQRVVMLGNTAIYRKHDLGQLIQSVKHQNPSTEIGTDLRGRLMHERPVHLNVVYIK